MTHSAEPRRMTLVTGPMDNDDCHWDLGDEQDDIVLTPELRKQMQTALAKPTQSLPKDETQDASPRKNRNTTKRTPRKRGRPVGAVSKTDQMRVDEQRKYQNNVEKCFPNLRHNELTSQINYEDPKTGELKTIQDKALSLIGTTCTVDHGLFVPTADARLLALKLAYANSFNPIHQFLAEALETEITEAGQAVWDNLDQIYTGKKDKHSLKILQSTLVGAVARTMEPGSPFPMMPIIEGRQGVCKSRGIKALVPREFHAELNSAPRQLLDDPSRLHVGWLIEFPECDRLFKPGSIEDLKTLTTTEVDETRRAYAELPTKLARKFVVIGTTNNREFLVDTENRRFPIISVEDGYKIDVDRIVKHRMEIWHLAQLAYRDGFNWIPDEKDLKEMATKQLSYQSRDPWAPLIFRYLVNRQEVSAQAILESVLEITKKDMTPMQSRRVGRILSQFGWVRLTIRKINGLSVRLWGPGINWDPTAIDL